MTETTGQTDDLWSLLEALCERRLTADETARLERIVLHDRQARRAYLSYIDLHGTLHWDTAQGARLGLDTGSDSADRVPIPTMGTVTAAPRQPTRSHRRWQLSAAAVAALAVVAGLVWWSPWTGAGDVGPVRPDPHDPAVAEQSSRPAAPTPATRPAAPNPPRPRTDGGPIQIEAVPQPATIAAQQPAPGIPSDPINETSPAPAIPSAPLPAGSTTETVVALIDDQLRAGWKVAGVQPSPPAEDAEWMRRVYLDIIGRIPSVEEAEAFLSDRAADKQARLVDALLDHPDYIRHWSTLWTNLLIGRSEARSVDRWALTRFLRESFARNRPWNDVVYDLVAAEGDSRENGAANFLLAHLNNEAVPATAITARLFLGTQVQCTQCHNHPFNDAKQDQFWELNSFFQQTQLVRFEEGSTAGDQPSSHAELVSKPLGGPIYYETRQGLMKAAWPQFDGVKVDPGPTVNRRRELARLMTADDQPGIAAALVNRMWDHFFGCGFTRPIDDMGPHNPPSHPELLDRLSEAFIRSGYDQKQLIRWICRSEAYRLSSRMGSANQSDNPAAGESPLFSRVYIKPMTPEQVYDSLLVATRADQVGHSNWEDVARQRQEWLQQFVIALGTEENDEADLFEGSIPQALALMNGELVRKALSARAGTFLGEVLAERSSEREKIRKLCLSALSREPTEREIALVRRLLRQRLADDHAPRTRDRQMALVQEGLQDIFWAYLNSAEFVLIH